MPFSTQCKLSDLELMRANFKLAKGLFKELAGTFRPDSDLNNPGYLILFTSAKRQKGRTFIILNFDLPLQEPFRTILLRLWPVFLRVVQRQNVDANDVILLEFETFHRAGVRAFSEKQINGRIQALRFLEARVQHRWIANLVIVDVLFRVNLDQRVVQFGLVIWIHDQAVECIGDGGRNRFKASEKEQDTDPNAFFFRNVLMLVFERGDQ